MDCEYVADERFRLCEFSSSTFGGFQHRINLETVESVDDIIVQTVAHLKLVLQIYHLRELFEKTNVTKWHIHSQTFNDILTTPNETIWICDHC